MSIKNELIKHVGAVGISLASIVASVTPVQASDTLEKLTADVKGVATTVQNTLIYQASRASLSKYYGSDGLRAIIKRIEKGCGSADVPLASLEPCLKSLYDIPLLTDEGISVLAPLSDRWRTLKGIEPLTVQTAEIEAGKQADKLEIINNPDSAAKVRDHLTANCANKSEATTKERQACNNAIIEVTFEIGKDAAAAFATRNAEAGAKITALCNTDLYIAVGKNPFSTADLYASFEVAQKCLQKIVTVGEDDLKIAFEPLRVNTALCKVAGMQGRKPIICEPYKIN